MVKNYGTSCEFTEESFFDSNSPIQSETEILVFHALIVMKIST